jgi:hypothetical protein
VSNSSARSLCVVLALALTAVGLVEDAQAVSITYTNLSPPPTHNVYGYAVANSSGQPSAGPALVFSPNAASVNHTTLGPSPPTIDSLTFTSAEIFTDLNLTGVGASRSIVVPGFGQFVAEGQSIAAGGFYTAEADVFSGHSLSPTAGTPWTIFVNPTGLEVAGTPTLITIDTSIVGEVAASAGATADASWLVSTNFGTVMNGAASQTVAGLTPFSDAGTLSFIIPLGGSFQMTLLYQLDAAGSGITDSRAEVFSSIVSPFKAFGPSSLEPTNSHLTITAEVGVAVVPEPGTLALAGIGAMGVSLLRRRRSARPNRS